MIRIAFALSIALSISSPAHAEPQTPACLETLPADLEKAIGHLNLARRSDYVPAIRNYAPPDYAREHEKNVTCSLYAVDLNEDGLMDYSALLINPGTGGFRFQIFVNRGRGKFESITARNYKKSPLAAREGTIYTSMSVKPAGEPGAGDIDYSPLGPREREV